MNKRIIIQLLLILAPMLVVAQTASIKGTIQDKNSQEKLYGVNILLKGTNTGTSSGANGEFEIKVTAGKHILQFSYLGYNTLEKTIVVADGETKELSIDLEEEVTLLNTTVISASRFEKKLGEETVSLDVIKSNFLEKQNLVTVEDAIKRNPGVSVIDKQVNIRGGSGYSYGAGSRVLMLLDDMPILQADAGSPNWTSIPLENVGQIEIIKGAASALYGSSALNGIINVRTAYATNEPVTKISTFGTVFSNPKAENDENGNPIDKQWWNYGNIYLSPDDSTKVLTKDAVRPYSSGINIGHRQKFGKFDLVLGAQALSGQEWKYGAFEHRGRLSFNTRYRVNENFNFGINGNIQAGKNGTFFLWNGYDGVNKYIPSSLVGEPTSVKAFRLTIDPYVSYSDKKGNKHKLLTRWYKVDNNSTNNQSNFSNYLYAEYQYQRKIDKIGLVVSGGFVSSYVVVKAPLYGDTTLSGRNIALYAQLDKKFFDKLNISVGARLENNKQTNTDGETKPVVRVGANYQAAEFTFIRASFGQGYRFPTIAERFIQTSLGTSVAIIPNQSLTSETGISAEFGVKQGIKIGEFKAFVDVAGFFTRYNNMMEFNPTTNLPKPFLLGFQSQNVGNTQILGIETSLQGEGKLFKKFPTTVVLGYTYISPKYTDFNEDAKSQGVTDYNVLKYRFRHTFTGAWDINFKGFDIGISGQYFSFMENIDNVFTLFIPGLLDYRESKLKSNAADLKPSRQYKGDFILDLRAGYTYIAKNNNRYKIAFLAKNVMNKEYSLRPGMIEAPANYTVRLDLEF